MSRRVRWSFRDARVCWSVCPLDPCCLGFVSETPCRVKLPGKGQAIVDVKGFRKVNPTLDMWNDDPHGSSNSDFKVVQQQGAATFDPELYHLLPPTIHGFSLPNKKWGEFLIAHLEHIDWLGKRSFDHLVIPDSYRSVIQALVDVHSGALKEKLISDVVEGKGSGLIIALHGKPGTGKTLTAEAVADHLKRPLYAVSAGELGMNPTNLERQLKDILELATSWRAVLLIDEADVFLEKRNSTQLDRNALVGVFLRRASLPCTKAQDLMWHGVQCSNTSRAC